MDLTTICLVLMFAMVVLYDSKLTNWMSKDTQYIVTFVFGALALLSELVKLRM